MPKPLERIIQADLHTRSVPTSSRTPPTPERRPPIPLPSRVASMVSKLSAAAELSSTFNSTATSRDPGDPNLPQMCVKPQDLVLRRNTKRVPPLNPESTAQGIKRTPSELIHNTDLSQAHSHKKHKLEPASQHTEIPRILTSPENRIQVPQSGTLDHPRSVMFSKPPRGVRVSSLLEGTCSVLDGEKLMTQTGGITLFLEWPGYEPTISYVTLSIDGSFQLPQPPNASYTQLTPSRTRITVREFAFRVAEKIRTWLCMLTRQHHIGEDKSWELTKECLPPVDEIEVLGVGPMAPDLHGMGMWSILLVRVLTP